LRGGSGGSGDGGGGGGSGYGGGGGGGEYCNDYIHRDSDGKVQPLLTQRLPMDIVHQMAKNGRSTKHIIHFPFSS